MQGDPSSTRSFAHGLPEGSVCVVWELSGITKGVNEPGLMPLFNLCLPFVTCRSLPRSVSIGTFRRVLVLYAGQLIQRTRHLQVLGKTTRVSR